MKLSQEELFDIIIGGQYKNYELSSMMEQDSASDSLWVLFYILYSPSENSRRTGRREYLFNIYKSLPRHLIKYILTKFSKHKLDVSILRKIDALIKLYKD
jgi:hypothetical protein